MAVGDYVIGTLVNTPTVFTFQPASSVVLLVTAIAGYNAIVNYSDGVLTNGQFTDGVNLGAGRGGFCNTKIFINNTTFIRILDNGVSRGFSGVQVA